MPATTAPHDEASSKPYHDEADIGSGERTPGQDDTDAHIRQVPPLPPSAPAHKAPPAAPAKP